MANCRSQIRVHDHFRGVHAGTRRAVILAAPVLLWPDRNAQAETPEALKLATFTSSKAGFAFNYPESWAVAIDRTSMQVAGTLAVVGDFPHAVTLNVSRQKLADYGGLSPTAAPQQLSDAILADLRKQPGLFDLQVLSSSVRQGADGRAYVDLEFRLLKCGGDIVEGRRGVRRCVTLDDIDVPIITKHVFQSAAIMGSYVYTAVGGTLETKWDDAAADIVAAARSFRSV